MAILITGAGYIGSVTVEYLLSLGKRGVVLHNLSRGHRQALAEHVPSYEDEVGDRDPLMRIMQEYDVESTGEIPRTFRH